MLADEPEPGTLGEVALQQWPGVHVPQGTRAGTAKLRDEVGQLFQRCGQHVVVISEAGVASDEAGAPCFVFWVSRFEGGICLTQSRGIATAIFAVGTGQGDNASSPWEHLLRIDSLG